MTTQTTSHQFEAIGTLWRIQVFQHMKNDDWDDLRNKIRQRVKAFDKTYSRFRDDSVVSQAARQAGHYELPADGYELLRLYERLYRVTGGKVTPLIGKLMEASGYDATYSFKQKKLRRPARWEDTLSYDKQGFGLTRPALLDFGAAGKGYLIDLVGELIEQQGIRSYLIDAGGDIRHRSTTGEAVEVGLENPFDTSEVIGVASLTSQSLCASAGSKRQWGNFHHLIDPLELKSPQAVAASWVVADDTATADGLATALFFTEPATLQKHFSFSYAVLYQDRGLHSSPDFPARIFTAETA